MRYIINDDDLEDWYSKLYKLNRDIYTTELDYILWQMENEFSQHVPDENMEKFLISLRERNV